MSKNTKFMVLNLDYELKDEERSDTAGKITPYSFVTRNLINIAFQQNYVSGMPDKTALIWRSIRRQLNSAIEDDKKDYMILSESDFNTIYDEVHKCNYLPPQASISPYLTDEVDKVKNRSGADNEALEAAALMLEKDATHEIEERGRESVIPSEGDVINKALKDVKETLKEVKEAKAS